MEIRGRDAVIIGGDATGPSAAANAAPVEEDAASAVTAKLKRERNAAWENRYAAEHRIWSGRVNDTLADVVAPLAPGRALDIGCGEGGDAMWLAEHGWHTTGLDVSATAVQRAADAARARGFDHDRVRFVAGDASDDLPEEEYDLVTASFLHSWEADFPRIEILRAAAARVAVGGRLVIVSHAAPPPWAREAHAHAPIMRTPEEELALLALGAPDWVPETVEVRRRSATSPTGEPAMLDDGVIVLRRER